MHIDGRKVLTRRRRDRDESDDGDDEKSMRDDVKSMCDDDSCRCERVFMSTWRACVTT
jgi:hypothetical protein